MPLIAKLNELRQHGGATRVRAALPTPSVTQRWRRISRSSVQRSRRRARAAYQSLRSGMPELLALDEDRQLRACRATSSISIAEDAVNPYVALAARGPWVVTLKGAVLHDSGGYGMLGFGHTPKAIIDAHERSRR